MTTLGSLLVKLGLQSSQYQKGITEASKSAERMAKTIESKLGGATSKFEALGNTVASKLTPVLGSRLAGAAKAAVAGIGTVITVIGTLTATVAVAGVAVGAFVGAITAGAFALAKAAVPVDGIRRAFEGFASTIEGGSSRMLAALQQASAGMVANADLMRSFNLAAQLVGVQFAQQLPEAMQFLGKVSQATGADMNFLLDSLARGVGRLSPLILDNLGVTINLSQAYQDWATANNRAVESMTKAEQQTAAMTQVIEKLRQNTASLPEVFGSAGQVFAAFAADLKNIKDQVGLDLLPTFTGLLSTFRQFLPTLSAFVSGFTGTFAAVAGVAKRFIKNLAAAMGVDFNQLAQNSEQWGANIVTQLARGMANAFSAVITVLNQLGQAIANWLAPGSPPKILPEIDLWGQQTAQEWLNGFAAADVSTLTELSGMVENFLRSLPADAFGGANLAQTILDFRNSIEQALATGGNVLSVIPQQLQGWASALISVQQAAERVAQAQEEVNAVTRQYEDRLKPITGRLSAIQKERDAFVEAQRRAQLQAIIDDPNADPNAVHFAQLEIEELDLRSSQEAIEAERDTAVQAAQDKLDAAQREQAAAEARLRVEEQLIQHQSETNRLLAEMVEGLEGATGGAVGAAGGIGSLVDSLDDLAGVGGGGLFGGIGDGVSALAEKIINQFKPVEKAAGDLGKTWGGVFSTMSSIVDEKMNGMKPSFNFLKKMLSGDLPSALGMLGDLWDSQWPRLGKTIQQTWLNHIKPAIDTVVSAIEDKLGFTLKDAGATAAGAATGFVAFRAAVMGLSILSGAVTVVGGLGSALTAVGAALSTAWVAFGTTAIGATVAGVVAALSPVIIALLAIAAVVGLLAAAWIGDWGGIQGKVQEVWEGTLKPALEGLANLLGPVVGGAVQMLSGLWNGVLLPALTAVWSYLQANVLPIFAAVNASINGAVSAALNYLTSLWQEVLLPAIRSVWNFIQTSVIPLLNALANVASAIVGKAIEALAILWDLVLLPALKGVWKFIESNILPILKDLRDFIVDSIAKSIQEKFIQPLNDLTDRLREGAGPAVKWFRDELLIPFQSALDGIAGAISSVVTWLGNMADAINNVDLGAITALLGNSPSPFENSLVGISNALNQLSRNSFPSLQSAMNRIEPPDLAMAADARMGGVFHSGLASAGSFASGQEQEPQVVVKFGDVIIKNDLDMQRFEWQVEKAVLRALRR